MLASAAHHRQQGDGGRGTLGRMSSKVVPTEGRGSTLNRGVSVRTGGGSSASMEIGHMAQNRFLAQREQRKWEQDNESDDAEGDEDSESDDNDDDDDDDDDDSDGSDTNAGKDAYDASMPPQVTMNGEQMKLKHERPSMKSMSPFNRTMSLANTTGPGRRVSAARSMDRRKSSLCNVGLKEGGAEDIATRIARNRDSLIAKPAEGKGRGRQRANAAHRAAVLGLDMFEAHLKEQGAAMQMNKAHWLWAYLPIQDPSSPFRRSWDLLSVFIILYSMYTTLFDLAFDQFLEKVLWIRISYLFIMLFFWVDVVLNFLTAYLTEEMELVMERKRIAANYMRGWFLVDVVSNLPIEGPFRLLKILRLARLGRVLNRWAQAGASHRFMSLFKIVVATLTAGHITACVFYWVAAKDGHPQGSWTEVEGLAGDGVEESEMKIWKAYVAALYFAYATLTTVGYGDISAHTVEERGVTILAVVLGSAIFAFIVGSVNGLLERSDLREEFHQQKLLDVNVFMSRCAFPATLREKIRRYYDLAFYSASSQLTMVNDLPLHLRREVLLIMYDSLIGAVPFLSEADNVLVTCLLEKMTTVVCVAKEYVLIEGELVSTLYVVKTGSVEVVDQYGLVVKVYNEGSFFGERCAYYEYYYAESSFRTKCDLELMYIDKADLCELLAAFPDFADSFEEIIQEREEHERTTSKKFTGKMQKMMMTEQNDIRPVTPPLGKKWNDDPRVPKKQTENDKLTAAQRAAALLNLGMNRRGRGDEDGKEDKSDESPGGRRRRTTLVVSPRAGASTKSQTSVMEERRAKLMQTLKASENRANAEDRAADGEPPSPAKDKEKAVAVAKVAPAGPQQDKAASAAPVVRTKSGGLKWGDTKADVKAAASKPPDPTSPMAPPEFGGGKGAAGRRSVKASRGPGAGMRGASMFNRQASVRQRESMSDGAGGGGRPAGPAAAELLKKLQKTIREDVVDAIAELREQMCALEDKVALALPQANGKKRLPGPGGAVAHANKAPPVKAAATAAAGPAGPAADAAPRDRRESAVAIQAFLRKQIVTRAKQETISGVTNKGKERVIMPWLSKRELEPVDDGDDGDDGDDDKEKKGSARTTFIGVPAATGRTRRESAVAIQGFLRRNVLLKTKGIGLSEPAPSPDDDDCDVPGAGAAAATRAASGTGV